MSPMSIMTHIHIPHLFRPISLLVLLSLLAPAAGAQQFSKKIHKLKEVEVVAERRDYYAEDQKITTLDSATLKNLSSNSMGELLSLATPIYIKSYGASGSLSVPNFRGTSSQHTCVNWNGFPVNSATLGQSDLSLTPAEFTDKVSIAHSAPSSLYGSGTFGGAISMENQAHWDQNQSITLSGELGSWSNQRYGLKGDFGNDRLQYRVNGLYQQAHNNFKYRDYQQFGQPIKRRRHNSVRNVGVMQNLFYKHSTRSKFEAGLWYQYRNKELPDIMGVAGQSLANQKDSSLRAYAGWKRIFDQASLQVKSAFFYHHQLYKEKENPGDEQYMIHSPITTRKWMNDLNYRHYLNNKMTLDLGIHYSRIQANVDAYDTPAKEYRAALIGAFQYKSQQLTTNLSLRQQLNSYTNPNPQFSIGANYKPQNTNLFIRTHFSTKYRLPTLNDKYWQPGGNKDLKPEHGWSGELGLGYVIRYNMPESSTKLELTAYQSNIQELIEWVPMESASFWHPVNTSRVRTNGLEATLSHTFQWNRMTLDLKTLYNYTRAINLNPDQRDVYGNQLRYTPSHSLKNNLQASMKPYTLGTSLRYTGKRYSTIDNDPSGLLDDYMLMDLYLSRKIRLEKIHGYLKLSVKNLLDKQYEVIANYPMPGRAYYINLNIQLNQIF
ncbi:MAG: TonB-dependent receptor [Bacteroidales bacterium]|nr:TonB-dependent receptor [Bacteroidales bacterium]